MAGASHHTLPTPDLPGVKILIVVAPYYKDIADDMVAGARATVEAAGGTSDLVEVPGALEVPTAIAFAHRSGRYEREGERGRHDPPTDIDSDLDPWD